MLREQEERKAPAGARAGCSNAWLGRGAAARRMWTAGGGPDRPAGLDRHSEPAGAARQGPHRERHSELRASRPPRSGAGSSSGPASGRRESQAGRVNQSRVAIQRFERKGSTRVVAVVDAAKQCCARCVRSSADADATARRLASGPRTAGSGAGEGRRGCVDAHIRMWAQLKSCSLGRRWRQRPVGKRDTGVHDRIVHWIPCSSPC